MRPLNDGAGEQHSPAAFDCFDRIEALAAARWNPRCSTRCGWRWPRRSRTPRSSSAPRSPSPASDDPRAGACVAFAEQFVVDVSGTTDDQRGALGAAMGADTFTFVQALYVVDVFQRGRIALERIFADALRSRRRTRQPATSGPRSRSSCASSRSTPRSTR